MKKEKIKVYLYTRVSTTMQIDGYSLDAQKTKMKAFCDYNEYEIAGEYEDAGKSGKSIEEDLPISKGDTLHARTATLLMQKICLSDASSNTGI